MSIISTTKELIELAKKGATIELELRLVGMQEREIELREELVKLKSELFELKSIASMSETLEFKDGMYFKDNVYYCQVCKDAKDKLIRLMPKDYERTNEYDHVIGTGTSYGCLNCGVIYTVTESPYDAL
jgi:hypothetical protein